MLKLVGMVCSADSGLKDFTRRMERYPEVFERATGERLYVGTLNVDVGAPVPIREDFRIAGSEIGEPNQDLVFERCLVNGLPAYRIRPMDANGGGGHGDHVLEISCSQRIPNVEPGSQVEIELFR